MNKVSKISAVFLLVVAFSFVSALLARADEDLCWDCLISTRDSSADPAKKAVAGDVITCRPCGWGWGTSEKDGSFRVQRITGITREEATALEAPALGNTGEIIRQRRFSVGETPVDADKVVVTDLKLGEVLSSPSGAVAALVADSFTIEGPDAALALPEE